MTIRAAAAVSEHPVPAQATGEVAGELLDSAMATADLLLVAVGPALLGALEDICCALNRLLRPEHCLGIVTAPLLGGGRVLAGTGGVMALAVTGRRWMAHPLEEGEAPPGPLVPEDAPAIFVVRSPSPPMRGSLPPSGDPLSVDPSLGGWKPAARWLGGAPARVVTGTIAGPPAAIWFDGSPGLHGVAVWCDPGAEVRLVHLEGLQTLGAPLEVTGAEGSTLHGLDGLQAAGVFIARLAELAADARAALTGLALRIPQGRLVEVGIDPATSEVRTSMPLRSGERVEIVVRSLGALAAEAEAVLLSQQPAAAIARLPTAVARGPERGAGAAPLSGGEGRGSLGHTAEALAEVSSMTALVGIGLDSPSARPGVPLLLLG